MIKLCLQKDPNKRPTCQELLAHRHFKPLVNEDVRAEWRYRTKVELCDVVEDVGMLSGDARWVVCEIFLLSLTGIFLREGVSLLFMFVIALLDYCQLIFKHHLWPCILCLSLVIVIGHPKLRYSENLQGAAPIQIVSTIKKDRPAGTSWILPSGSYMEASSGKAGTVDDGQGKIDAKCIIIVDYLTVPLNYT